MDFAQFITLFVIAFVFVITPGPGVLAIFAKSMSQGFIPVVYLSVGMVLGDMVYLAAVIFSLDLFSELIISVMDWVRILGGGYLIYLGLMAWGAKGLKLSDKSSHKTNLQELSTGFFISITNPKVMVFYLAVLPAFMDLSQTDWLSAIEIMLVFGLGLVSGAILIGAAANRIRILFTKPGMDRRINQVVGVVMIGAGILLALS